LTKEAKGREKRVEKGKNKGKSCPVELETTATGANGLPCGWLVVVARSCCLLLLVGHVLFGLNFWAQFLAQAKAKEAIPEICHACQSIASGNANQQKKGNIIWRLARAMGALLRVARMSKMNWTGRRIYPLGAGRD